VSAQLPLALSLRHPPALDDFVVGDNGVVLQALRDAVEPQGEPLIFLSGPAGCGRSHLLMGQCAAAQRRGLRSQYLPLAAREDLTPRMLEGLEAVDLLACDDVHLIAGEPDWEQALFGLFNRCRERGTKMLFSADRGPAALPIGLADLRSRLSWGLTLAVQPLDDEGRLALLEALARRHGLPLPAEVARYILERTGRHPRDLLATVQQLDRASLAEHRRLTIPFVRRCLGLD
jgi:DnaA family protein